MADFPHLPLFTDAYLADTRHLTTEEHGAYLLLLMEAWRRPECSLPDDDRLLARLCGLSVERWGEIKGVIMDFWHRDGRRKTWTQKRLLKERLFVAQKSASQRDKAAKRWKKGEKPDATALPNRCPEDAPTPTPTPTPSSLRSEEPQTPDLGLLGGEGESPKKVKKPDRFDEFWAAYPHKAGKQDARKAWQKAMKDGIDPEVIIIGAGRYAAWLANAAPGDFRPAPKLPQGWISGRRWEDSDIQPAPRPRPYRYVQGGIVT